VTDRVLIQSSLISGIVDEVPVGSELTGPPPRGSAT
jgi:hypothetical protein